jgi:hypothetical protein
VHSIAQKSHLASALGRRLITALYLRRCFWVPRSYVRLTGARVGNHSQMPRANGIARFVFRSGPPLIRLLCRRTAALSGGSARGYRAWGTYCYG